MGLSAKSKSFFIEKIRLIILYNVFRHTEMPALIRQLHGIMKLVLCFVFSIVAKPVRYLNGRGLRCVKVWDIDIHELWQYGKIWRKLDDFNDL